MTVIYSVLFCLLVSTRDLSGLSINNFPLCLSTRSIDRVLSDANQNFASTDGLAESPKVNSAAQKHHPPAAATAPTTTTTSALGKENAQNQLDQFFGIATGDTALEGTGACSADNLAVEERDAVKEASKRVDSR